MPSETIINAVIGLCEAFGRTATEATIGAYEIGLRGLTDAQVTAAMGLALQRCKFMPVPAELRELALGSGQSYDAMAEKAFDALRRGIQQTGGDYSVNFADGAINATVRALGGWQRACDMPVEEFDKWFRKDFIGCYVNICRNGASPEAMRYLGGTLERDNAAWDGQVNPRSGKEYRLEFFGGGVRTIGSDYPPALPAPAVPERKQIGASREFLSYSETGRLSAPE
jgi:hypothetical protein